MATVQVIRQRVFDNLYGPMSTDAPFVTRLASSHSTSPTSMTVLDEDDWAVGDVVENTETGAQHKVVSVSSDSSDVLTVVSAWNGTGGFASVGADDVLYKNPRFTVFQVDNAVTTVALSLNNWGIHVFGVGTITRADPRVFYETAGAGMALPYGVLKIYTVKSSSERPEVLPFRFYHNLGSGPTEYSTGRGVHIGDFGSTSDGDTLHYIYAQVITGATIVTARQEELLVAGATVSVLGGAIAPATQDPGARTDRTVQPGQISRDLRYFQGQFFTQARTEAALLAVERAGIVSETPRMTRSRRWVS